MSVKIGLYDGLTRHGGVDLDSVFVMEPADYVCDPQGVITHDEVAQIAKVLRRESWTHAGVVGKYAWREEGPLPKPVLGSGLFSSTA
jgi:hypothetical protein